jgi:hypothetical protein
MLQHDSSQACWLVSSIKGHIRDDMKYAILRASDAEIVRRFDHNSLSKFVAVNGGS